MKSGLERINTLTDIYVETQKYNKTHTSVYMSVHVR